MARGHAGHMGQRAPAQEVDGDGTHDRPDGEGVDVDDGAAAVDANAFAIGAIVFSISVDFLRWRALTHIARVTSSHALSADALHYSSDLISSVLVLIGLAATRAGYAHADALAAIDQRVDRRPAETIACGGDETGDADRGQCVGMTVSGPCGGEADEHEHR